MDIRYYINNKFEDVFVGEREISESSFKSLNEVTKKWIEIIELNRKRINELNGRLNLVYHLQDNSVLPRNFDNYELVVELSYLVCQH